MLPVIYSMSVSLDGFIAGPDGDISWTAPDTTRSRCAFTSSRPATSPAPVRMRPVPGNAGVGDRRAHHVRRRGAGVRADLAADPKGVFSRTLNSVAGNARLATDDIATEVGRLRNEPG